MPGKKPNEGARRCSMCGISYPVMLLVCRGCGEETDYISNVNPDVDWGERAAAVRVERGEGAGPIPLIKADVDVFPGGEFCISVEDVVNSGVYEPLVEDTIIQIGKQFFIVLAMVSGKQQYWIRSFSMQPSEEDMAWLADATAL